MDKPLSMRILKVVTEVVEVPEQKAPDETVAESDEEDGENPRTVAYV